MKNSIKLILTLLLTISFVSVFAQPKATATAQINAQIIQPIQITKIVDMNFGNIIASSTDGTVILSTENTRNATSGAYLPTAIPGTITSARFKTIGYANTTYSITLPNGNSVKITKEGGNGNQNQMFVTDFISDPTTGTLGSNGEQEFNVGATLQVQANQPYGVYVGSFDVRVNYN